MSFPSLGSSHLLSSSSNPFSAELSRASGHCAIGTVSLCLSLSRSFSELLSSSAALCGAADRFHFQERRESARLVVAASSAQRGVSATSAPPICCHRSRIGFRPATDRPTMGRPPGIPPMGARVGRGEEANLTRWPFPETTMTSANGRAAAGGDQPMAARRDQTRPKIRANQSGVEAALPTGDHLGGRRRRRPRRPRRPQPTRPPDPPLEDRLRRESHSAPVSRGFKTEDRTDDAKKGRAEQRVGPPSHRISHRWSTSLDRVSKGERPVLVTSLRPRSVNWTLSVIIGAPFITQSFILCKLAALPRLSLHHMDFQ